MQQITLTKQFRALFKFLFLKKPKSELTQEEIAARAMENELKNAAMRKLINDPLVQYELKEKGSSSGYITKSDGIKSKYWICGAPSDKVRLASQFNSFFK